MKKRWVLFLILIFCVWLNTGTIRAQSCPVSYGDTNGNGVGIDDLIVWYQEFKSNIAVKADFNCDGVVNTADLIIWYISYKNPSFPTPTGVQTAIINPKYGACLSSFKISSDVYPVPDGQNKFNKSTSMEVSELLSKDSNSSWAKQELNSANKTQFIQTNISYYTKKSELTDYNTQPKWINQEDINKLGYDNWVEIPANYPIWSDAAVRWDGLNHVKTGFAAGTTVFRGWRDINNQCVSPGKYSTFYNQQTATNQYLMVLEGAFGDAAPAPENTITLCNSYIWQENEFENFVRNNPGNNYYIFNEMNLGYRIGQDIMSPELYVHQYKYYLNMILGHPGCTYSNGDVVNSHQGWDKTAKITIGVVPLWPNTRTGPFGDEYDWYKRFYDEWTKLNQNRTCTPRGPFQMEANKIHTDGILLYMYADQPSSSNEICSKFNIWKNNLINVLDTYPSKLDQYFSNITPIVKEIGIHRFDSAMYPTNPDYYYGNKFEEYDNINASLATLMIMWLNEFAIDKYNIKSINWLPTYDFTNWKRAPKSIPLAIRKCNLPGNPFNCSDAMISNNGDQTFYNTDGDFSNKLLDAFYKSIRSDYSIIDPSLNKCGLQF